MTFLAVVAAAALTITATAPAITETTTRVVTHDIDLATVQGRRVLDLRIARAADALCADANARLSSVIRHEVRRCRADAIATARARATVRLAAR